MATRFRLPASGAAAVSPALQSYSHSQTTRRPLPTSDSTTLATQAYTPDAADHLVAGDAHHVQFVSAPLAAQTISAQTVKLCLQALEDHTNNNLFVQLWIGLVSFDGTTARSTILAKTADDVEIATSLTSRTMSATTTSQTCVAGDRLVVEISVTGTPAAAGGTQGHNAQLRFGSDGAGGDLAENDVQTGTTLNPWLEFANTLTFGTFTQDQTAFRIFEDGIESHAGAIANDGLRHMPQVALSGLYPSSPSAAANQLTADLDVIVLVCPDKWSATDQDFISKWTSTGSQKAYRFGTTAASVLELFVSNDGSTLVLGAGALVSSFPTVDGQPLWLKCSFDANDGSGNRVGNFYYAAFDGTTTIPSSWTFVSTSTTAGTTSIFASSTAILNIGARDVGTASMLAGKVYRALLYDGIGGTLKVDYHPNGDATDGATSFTSATGEVWTMNGSAAAQAAANTNITRTVNRAVNLTPRFRAQEGGYVSGATTDNWGLYVSKNGGGYTLVTTGSTGVKARNSPTMTDGGATAQRLGAGTNSFVAGLVSEDGTADNLQLTAGNYTEFAFPIQLVYGEVLNGDTYDFRVYLNGSPFGAYTQTARITIVTAYTPPASGPAPHYTRRMLTGGMPLGAF